MGAHLQIAFISGFEKDIVKLEFDPSGAKLGQQCWKTYEGTGVTSSDCCFHAGMTE